MKFNVQKCKVMHIGKNNMEYKYTMNGTELESTKTEKDLGVVMSSVVTEDGRHGYSFK